MIGMTLFTGFDGAGIGMQAAGIEMVAGIEYDDAIAAVARANGHPVRTANILDVDPADYLGIEALHASPPCPNFSLAKAGRGETRHDIDLARAVCRFLEVLIPKVFTLENVWLYRQSKSWRMIEDTLFRLGYLPDVQHLNAADFGVPQTRKRMIVRAVRGQMAPPLPAPVPWIGWYEAIEDLIPTLPESQFAPWQLERLPEEMKTFLFPGSGNTNFNDAEAGKGARDAEEPAHVVASGGGGRIPRAFLVHPTDQRTMPVVDQQEPMFTVTGNHGNGNMPRAFLIGNDRNGDDRKRLNQSSRDDPAFTITNSNGTKLEVVKMTPRALARLQSFPDDYELPTSLGLACKGIGNACPPLEFEVIYKQFDGG